MKDVLIAGGATLVSAVNNICPKIIETAFPWGNGRDLDHLLAGIGIPYMYDLASKSLEKYFGPGPEKFSTYGLAEVAWEACQAIERGGQVDFNQLPWDIAGVVIGYGISRFWSNEKFLQETNCRLGP